MNNFVGKSLDNRYSLLSVIGTGGMSVVYKANDLLENRTVAVKILREECIKNEELVRRFKNESKAISVLDHPNIVQVYDVSVQPNIQYIVMEYIEGITLKEYMRHREFNLPYNEILHFVSQTLLALQHAHAKGIVHRDIKPHNIMLLPDGRIKVMDFGIARFARSENQTLTDKAIGSVHYISPEQAKGDVTDLKADIYSVGVMIYEMLAGKLPFEGDTPVGVAIKQISDVAVPLREIKPDIPQGLEDITKKAMAKNARERYQTAGQMLADVEAFKRDPQIVFGYQFMDPIKDVVDKNEAVRTTANKRTANSKISAATKKGSKRPGGSRTRKNARKSFDGKKWIWPAIAGGTLAFFLISAFACYSILKTTILFTEGIDVELPSFVDQMRSDIEGNPEYDQFTNIVFEVVPNVDKPEGMVVSQTPKPPQTVKTTATIVLQISSGITQVSVPNIIGADQSTAINALKDAGLSVMTKRQEVENENDPYGYVLALTLSDGTSIGEGQILDSGTLVYVYVSAEFRDDRVELPQLVGLTSIEEAQNLIVEKGLGVGAIVYEDSLLPAGSIIRQDPVFDDVSTEEDANMVQPGTLVTLVVSQGHTHTYVEVSRVEPIGCTTPGIITYTCSVCSDTYTEAIPAHGHDWGEWEVVTPAEVGVEGLEKRTCKRDENHTETRVIPALEETEHVHDWGEWVVVTPAEVGKEGLEERTCKTDSSHTETRVIPALDEP